MLTREAHDLFQRLQDGTISRRTFVTRAVALGVSSSAIVALLQACGSNSSAGSATASTLSFWIRDSDAVLVKPLVKAYNGSHKTQIKLNIIPAASFVQKFGTAVAGGEAPDIVAIDLIYMPAFDAAQEMTDITAMAQKLSYYNNLLPSHTRLATYNGKLYALPFSADGSVLLWNKQLFKQAGLDPNTPPTNWSEIESYAKKITALGNGYYGYYFSGACAGCNAFTFLPLIWASGGDVLSADGKTATMTSPIVKEAMAFYQRLWANKQIPQAAQVDNGTNFTNAFATGKIGIVGSGALAIAGIKQQFPQLDFGITYLPGMNGGTASFSGGDVIGVPKGSKYVTEAFNFIDWCLSTSTQENIYPTNAGLPLRNDIPASYYSKNDPEYPILFKAEFEGRTPFSTVYNQLFNDQNGPWLEALQQAIFKGQIDQALTTAQQRFTQIISSSANS